MRAGKLNSAIFGLLLAATLPSAVNASEAGKDYSDAEKMIFMREHLANISPPQTLRYTFRKSGSLEEGFEDSVTVSLRAGNNGECCTANAEFLNGVRKTGLPEVEGAKSNPVILYFLEHDVRDMQRHTGGQPNHFRKRIRMAIYNGASVNETTLRFQEKDVPGYEVEISPYDDDPNRARFERFADKRYVFMLSDAVPGGVYGIRTHMRNANDGTALTVEEMYIEGAAPRSGLAHTLGLEDKK